MNKIFRYKTCNRCHHTSKFLNTYYYKNFIYSNDFNSCKYCKAIPDVYLDAFIDNFYMRQCPNCKKIIHHNSRQSYFHALKKNKICKSCANHIKTEKRHVLMGIMWKPIIGMWPITYKKFVAIRTYWNNLSGPEQQKFLKLTIKQKQNFWSHLRRKNQVEGHRKCREIMAQKYSGENHWMKRPEVLKKIKNSCKKYCGNGHWFRRNK